MASETTGLPLCLPLVYGQAVTGCLVWALDRTTFRHTILEAGQHRRQKYEQFIASVSPGRGKKGNKEAGNFCRIHHGNCTIRSRIYVCVSYNFGYISRSTVGVFGFQSRVVSR